MRAGAQTLVLVLLAGCFDAAREDASPGDDDADDGLDPMAAPCAVDTDCTGAGPSCCGCPEYAIDVASEFAQACEDVDCPPLEAGTCNAAARCDEGACVLGCVAASCDGAAACAGGFALDAAGCLTCSCGPDPGLPECTLDTDCVRVAADCCGCAEGGADTAVPAGSEQDHRDSLGCSGSPVCPGVDVCEPGATARCLAGRCALAADSPVTDLPPNACGTPDLPPCPAGQACWVNSDAIATMAGVGVCL